MKLACKHSIYLLAALVLPATRAAAQGGDDCASAVDLTPSLVCDGAFHAVEPLGMATALPGVVSGSCWSRQDPADNDRWYSFTNVTAAPLLFAASTYDDVNAGADSEIAVYADCAGNTELACAEDIRGLDNSLSTTAAFAIPAGQTVFVQLDGYGGDDRFDRGLFLCATAPPAGGGDCATAIDLGILSPDPVAPVVVRPLEWEPAGASDYNLVEPTLGNVLSAPEACYAFTAAADGWVQIGGGNVSDDGRVILSADGGLTFAVSPLCSVVGGNRLGFAPQYGTAVAAGLRYCFCLDSGPAPLVEPGGFFDLEVHDWARTTAPNVDCASSALVDFCGTTVVTRAGLSTAGAALDPLAPPGGCGPGPWSACSGLGADLEFELEWIQGMVDCGCAGFRVTETAPAAGGRPPGHRAAQVCDAALAIARSCPVSSACVATVDAGPAGTDETATVSGLGAADVGTRFTIEADHNLQSACPDFAVTVELTGCMAGCDVCAPCVRPSGAVGNVVEAVIRGGTDVEIAWPGATIAPPNYAVYRTPDKTTLTETPAGIGSQPRIAVTPATVHVEAGIIPSLAEVRLYVVLPADSCDRTVFP